MARNEMIASTPLAFSNSTLCERNGSAVGKLGSTRIFVNECPALSAVSAGKKRAASLSTLCFRKPKISGLLLSICGVNTPVCQPFTETTAFWTKGSSFEKRKKSGFRSVRFHAGL